MLDTNALPSQVQAMSRSATPVTASMNFDVKYLKKGKSSVILLLPQDMCAEIGSIIAHWGMFESAFDATLASLIEGERDDGGTRDTALWRRQKFKRRRKLFCAICKEWLSGWKPESATALKTLIDRSGDIATKRNLIAHGSYAYSIAPYSDLATNCRAINQETGEQFDFDLEVLKKLRQDISHLTADLLTEFQKFGAVEGMPPMIEDAELQRIYRDTEHPWNPNPAKRTSSPSAEPK